MDSNNFHPVSHVNPNKLPDGFLTVQDPHSTSSNTSSNNGETKRRQTLLEQVLTPDAAARLRRSRAHGASATSDGRRKTLVASRLTERIEDAI